MRLVQAGFAYRQVIRGRPVREVQIGAYTCKIEFVNDFLLFFLTAAVGRVWQGRSTGGRRFNAEGLTESQARGAALQALKMAHPNGKP